MKEDKKVLMEYLYHQEWKEKCVTLGEVHRRVIECKYQHRVEAARELREIAVKGGMVGGTIAAETLPRIRPAIGANGAYTGLVLLSFRLNEGLEVLEAYTLTNSSGLWMSLQRIADIALGSLESVALYTVEGGTLGASSFCNR